MSKLLTMVAVVKAGLDLDASIVKYIPELKHKSNAVGGRTWEEVTMRSLGGHLAGIQRDCMYIVPDIAARLIAFHM